MVDTTPASVEMDIVRQTLSMAFEAIKKHHPGAFLSKLESRLSSAIPEVAVSAAAIVARYLEVVVDCFECYFLLVQICNLLNDTCPAPFGVLKVRRARFH